MGVGAVAAAAEGATILKTRHIGNDWVSVVWSEGERDFLPGTLTSQLSTVVIVLYPLRRFFDKATSSGKSDSSEASSAASSAASSEAPPLLFRVEILAKAHAARYRHLGPLTDGAVVAGGGGGSRGIYYDNGNGDGDGGSSDVKGRASGDGADSAMNLNGSAHALPVLVRQTCANVHAALRRDVMRETRENSQRREAAVRAAAGRIIGL